MPENVRARAARSTSALLLTLAFALLYALALAALCSGAALTAQVEARHQAERMTDLGSPDWATMAGDETGDDGTHMRFKEIADGADRLRFTTTTAQSVDEIRFRARLSPAGAGDDRLAVWVDGVKRGSVLPPVQQTMTTRALSLGTPIAAGSHTVEVGPNQLNDAFVAFDWLELSNTGVAPPPPDQDGDGVPDSSDNCQAVANAGQSDADDDGIGDACDGPGKRDSDGDGVQNRADRCADTPVGTVVGADGCAAEQPPADSDGDGVADGSDHCPDTPAGTEVNEHGCPLPPPPDSGADTDGDGMTDANDNCDDLANLAKTNQGCPYPQSQDYDYDGIVDAQDSITGREKPDPGFGGAGETPRAKAHCEVYATNRIDPIARAQHLHRQFGNTSTTNESTGAGLEAANVTSCKVSWLTSAAWFPAEADGDNPGGTIKTVKGVNVYYRGFDDERLVQNIPTGVQLLTPDQKYGCVGSLGEGGFQDSPVYNCQGSGWTSRSIFPDCLDLRRPLEESVNLVESNNDSVCPASHPYRIPKINHLISHDTPVPNPLVVSIGTDQWGDWSLMHGDYLTALQPEFNRNVDKNGDGTIQEATEESLIQYCIREGRGQQTGPERCGNEPG
jgi:hypothetical protein